MTDDCYDLANADDFERFAVKYGRDAAKALRFSLAYCVNHANYSRTTLNKQIALTRADYAKLEAAFASEMRK